MRSATDIGARL